MTIEEQLAAIEQRIGQLNIIAAGCTERAEQAAERAEQAAARAELAAAAGVNAAAASVNAAVVSVEAATIPEPEPEPAKEIEESEDDDDDETETEKNPEVHLPGREAGEADNKPGLADTEPIHIRITTPAEPGEQRRTVSYRFKRGR